MMRTNRVLMVALAGSIAAFLAGCPSPVQDAQIEALGGECPNVPESEFHRGGQPCVLCHGDYQGDSPNMSLGGTIYATPTQPVPVAGATVIITDANGEQRTATTNCIGNFFITSDDWTPAFPLNAQIDCPVPGSNEVRRLVMGTRISRDGSCAGCHFGPPAQDSPGWIYCAKTQPTPPYEEVPNCPGKCQ